MQITRIEDGFCGSGIKNALNSETLIAQFTSTRHCELPNKIRMKISKHRLPNKLINFLIFVIRVDYRKNFIAAKS